MLWKTICVSVISLLMAACAAQLPVRCDPALYTHCYKGFDLDVAWKTRRDGANLAVLGAITNNRNEFLRDLELTVTLLDDQGKKLSSADFMFIPNIIRLDEIKPFGLMLTVPPGSAPQRLKFRYSYYQTGNGIGFHLPFFYEFEADL